MNGGQSAAGLCGHGKSSWFDNGGIFVGPSLVPNVGVPSMIKPVVTAVSTAVWTEMHAQLFSSCSFQPFETSET